MRHKLMQVMTEREGARVLTGRVEIDDAYLGGSHSGVRGRGDPAKVSFVVAVQTNAKGRPSAIRLDCVADMSGKALIDWAQKALAPSAKVVSDAWPSFVALEAGREVRGEIHITGGGKAAAQHAQFHWVNTVLSNLKTSPSGTLHAFAFKKYAQRYLSEFAWRFNRRTDLPSLVPRLLTHCAKTSPRPRAFLMLSESRC
jgi:ISXO2-like transposase domain